MAGPPAPSGRGMRPTALGPAEHAVPPPVRPGGPWHVLPAQGAGGAVKGHCSPEVQSFGRRKCAKGPAGERGMFGPLRAATPRPSSDGPPVGRGASVRPVCPRRAPRRPLDSRGLGAREPLQPLGTVPFPSRARPRPPVCTRSAGASAEVVFDAMRGTGHRKWNCEGDEAVDFT